MPAGQAGGVAGASRATLLWARLRSFYNRGLLRASALPEEGEAEEGEEDELSDAQDEKDDVESGLGENEEEDGLTVLKMLVRTAQSRGDGAVCCESATLTGPIPSS